MSSEYDQLQQALNDLRATQQQLSHTMKEIRAMLTNEVANEDEEQRRANKANAFFTRCGYSPESNDKLRQWGIFSAKTDEDISDILHDVIDYRRDKANGTL